jgi:hypothetical protein
MTTSFSRCNFITHYLINARLPGVAIISFSPLTDGLALKKNAASGCCASSNRTETEYCKQKSMDTLISYRRWQFMWAKWQ